MANFMSHQMRVGQFQDHINYRSPYLNSAQRVNTSQQNQYSPVPTSGNDTDDNDWVGLKQKHIEGDKKRQLFDGHRKDKDDNRSIASDEDIDDQPFRLASLKTTVFDTYAVCAALLSSFSCSTTFISEEEIASLSPAARYTTVAQQIVVRICILGGIHAMLVFMFCALYAKTALSRPKYGLKVYERFSGATGGIRQQAFWSMYYTALMYCFQIVLTNFYSLDWPLATVCSVILLMLIARVIWDAQSIIKSAGIIFMPDEAIQKMLDEERLEKAGNMPGAAMSNGGGSDEDDDSDSKRTSQITERETDRASE